MNHLRIDHGNESDTLDQKRESARCRCDHRRRWPCWHGGSHHLAPASLSSGENVFEALGAGFTLLAIGVPQATLDRFRSAAADQNLPLTIFVTASEGEVLRYGAALVLVRPDEFVAWVGNTPEISDAEIREVLRVVQAGVT